MCQSQSDNSSHPPPSLLVSIHLFSLCLYFCFANQIIGGMEKDVAHIYNGILLSHKKERKLVICNNMGGLGGCCAKLNKSDRER